MQIPNIRSEVRKLVADKIANGEQVLVPWITQEVLEKHSDIEGDDKDFYLICARSYVREIVRSCIEKYNRKSAPSDRELVLPGFDHLQIAYTVEREGRTILVPIDQLSDEELSARADELDAMARGCRAHAREIRGYLAKRCEAA